MEANETSLPDELGGSSTDGTAWAKFQWWRAGIVRSDTNELQKQKLTHRLRNRLTVAGGQGREKARSLGLGYRCSHHSQKWITNTDLLGIAKGALPVLRGSLMG